MKELPKDVLSIVKEKAEDISYGSIQIELNENGNFVDILVTERIRVKKEQKNTRISKKRVTRNDENI